MTSLRRAAWVVALVSFLDINAQAQSNTPSSTSGASVEQQDISSKAAAKVERKRQRKEARAKKNSELKKLEANGYRPGQSGPGYPDNLEKAEKQTTSSGAQTK